jgi:hypothetical protein
MDTKDIEAVNLPGHRITIKPSKKPGKWDLAVSLDGELREAYRPMDRDEVISVLSKALRSS